MATGSFTGPNSTSPVPTIQISPEVQFLRDVGGSYDQNIDGSVTPVEFYWGPPAGEVWFVDSIALIIDDTGNANATNYGARSGLANGVLVTQLINAATFDIVNLQNNGDIVLSFNFGIGKFDGGGFLNFSKGFGAQMIFSSPITLHGDDGDRIIMIIRDNLSGLSTQRASAQTWRVL